MTNIADTLTKYRVIKKITPLETVAPKKVEPFNLTVGTLNGEPLSIDLGDFAHMMIAGRSGSGKSTWVNSFMMALLNRPVRILGVDCKEGVELAPWEKRLDDLAETPTAATELLEKAKIIVERRLKVMKNSSPRLRKYDPILGPRYVLIIDEAAEAFSLDITPASDETFKQAKSRATDELNYRLALLRSLAARARAAGLTIILATQRPDADIIPGVVKLSLERKICCRVDSTTDLEVIFGKGGTEGVCFKDIPESGKGMAHIKGFTASSDMSIARSYWYTDEYIESKVKNFDYARWANHWGIDSTK